MFCFDYNVKLVYMDFNKYVKIYKYVLFFVSLKDKKIFEYFYRYIVLSK